MTLVRCDVCGVDYKSNLPHFMLLNPEDAVCDACLKTPATSNPSSLTLLTINDGTFVFKFVPSTRTVEASKGKITGKFGLFVWNPSFEKAKLMFKSYKFFLHTRESPNAANMDQVTIKFIRSLERGLAKVMEKIMAANPGKTRGSWIINQDGSFQDTDSHTASAEF